MHLLMQSILCLLAVSVAIANVDKILQLKSRIRVEPTVQAATVQEMIGRFLPSELNSKFNVTVKPEIAQNGYDVFVLRTSPDDEILQITGNNGIAAAAGFQYYVKEYCGGHFSWSSNQLSLPDKLPVIESNVTVVARDLFRYYQNTCTSSYSFVWWDWSRWEREIDWMAINSINLPLAFSGQEEIFRRVYLRLNFTQQDLDDFFTGPAFLAWGRMGNIDAWGGPVPDSWYKGQLELQHQILNRMRDFGMIPVLPGFSGHVPRAITRVYPDVNVTHISSDWNDFGPDYCCTYVLDQTEELFNEIGKNFIIEMEQEFGVDHIYNVDTFNENTPSTTDPDYISGLAEAVFKAMTDADQEAIWLMQGWLFHDSYWTPELAKALLTSVPIGRMIILDLDAEVRPLYSAFESFYGQPFIWCMLQNYGGTKGLFGTIDEINKGPEAGRSFSNSTMIGTGLTPEGIEQNDVIYELMNELAWREKPVADLQDWVTDYARRRYGVRNQNASSAWCSLIRSAYNCSGTGFHGRFTMVVRPSLKLKSILCYDPFYAIEAWDAFIGATSDETLIQSDLFRHDLVDLTRENLIIYTELINTNLKLAFLKKETETWQTLSNDFLGAIEDMETILATDKRFLLGVWLESAKNLATNENESRLYEYNARNQITLWGPKGEISDYATKQWAGIAADYYLLRWQLFLQTVYDSLANGTIYVQSLFDKRVFAEVETPFTLDRKDYSTEPVGDSVEIALQIYGRIKPLLKDAFEQLEVLRSAAPDFQVVIQTAKLANQSGLYAKFLNL